MPSIQDVLTDCTTSIAARRPACSAHIVMAGMYLSGCHWALPAVPNAVFQAAQVAEVLSCLPRLWSCGEGPHQAAKEWAAWQGRSMVCSYSRRIDSLRVHRHEHAVLALQKKQKCYNHMKQCRCPLACSRNQHRYAHQTLPRAE